MTSVWGTWDNKSCQLDLSKCWDTFMGTFLDHVQVLGICPVGAFMVAESYFSEHSRVRNCPDTVDKQIRLICLHSWIDKLTSVQHKFQKSKIRPLRTNVYTSRFSTQNPKPCNTHTYHFHIPEWFNVIFFQIMEGGEIN